MTAQPISGIYVGGAAGLTDLQDQNVTSVQTGAGPLGPASIRTNGMSLRSLTGLAALGSIGYGLGNGLRLELEGSYRQNQTHRLFGDPTHNPASVNGWNRTSAVMANAVYDFDLRRWPSIPWVFPYLGIGAGFAFETLHNLRIASQNPSQPYVIAVDDTQGRLAVQAMAGVAIPIAAVPGLSLTAEYRLFVVMKDSVMRGSVTSAAPLPAGTTPGSARLDQVLNHAMLFGLRYAFGPGPSRAAPGF